MNDDLERRLRDSLQARAQDVEPTPQLYRRVEAQVNRSQRWMYALSGVGVAVVVAVAVVVVPSLLQDDGRPDIANPPSPTEAPETPGPSPSPTDGEPGGSATVPDHTVLAGNDRIWVVDNATGDEVVELVDFGGPENESDIVAVEVRPGSTLDDLTVVYVLRGEGTFTFGYVTSDGSGVTNEQFPQDKQPTADLIDGALPIPAFDPTGSYLAWIEPRRGEENQSPVLRTIGWSDGPGTGRSADDNAEFTLDAIAIEFAPSDYVVDDWVWTDGTDGARSGSLLVTGALEAWQIAVEQQGDGALVIPSDAVELVEVPERAVIDLAVTVGDVRYTLVAGGSTSQDAEDANVVLLISRPDGSTEFPVPDVATADPSSVWMTAYGDAYAIGLGGATQLFLGEEQREYDASYADFVR